MAASPTPRRLLHTALLTLGYTLLGGFVLFPIYWIFTMSLKEFGDIIAYPPRFSFVPTFENYREILFGNEADGLDDSWQSLCQQRLTIPMRRGTDSLNVAIAAAAIRDSYLRQAAVTSVGHMRGEGLAFLTSV